MRTTRALARLMGVWSMAGACAGAIAAQAQEPAPAAPPPAAPAPLAASTIGALLEESPRTRAAAAERLARTAILVLRLNPDPTERDFRIAALTLNLARRLTPDDTELLRHEIVAWISAGDQARVLQATKRLVELDPLDTVAQLRIISMQLSAIQEAEKRLDAYTRLLGPRGATLDDSIRSRLALDAALLSRERGDDDGFRERMTQAAQLDSSNKEAAVLAATYFLERSDDPLGRVEMLANVVLADPADPSANLNLARELRRHGAFMASQRFQSNAEQVFQRMGVQPDTSEFVEALVSQWQSGSTEVILEAIGRIEGIARENRRRTIAGLEAAGQPSGDPLEEFRLPIEMETVRLAANIASGRQTGAEASLRSIVSEAIRTLQTMAEPPPGAPVPTVEEQDEARERLAGDVLWARLWCGAETEQAEAALNALIETGVAREAAINRYKGWLALRKGDLAGADTLLTPLATVDPQARLGLAALAEARGDKRLAAKHYAYVASAQPEALLGAFARRRIETVLGESLAPTPTAAAIDAYAAKLPPWLSDMAQNPKSYMFLDVVPERQTASVIDGTHLLLTLRNVGRTPLAMGRDAAMPSRVLLTPAISFQRSGGRSADSQAPEVIELDRRLRLKPGEAIQTRVWAGQGSVGDFIDSVSPAFTLRWRATVGFVTDGQGRLGAGLGSITADAGLMSRPAVETLGLTPEKVRDALFQSQGDTLLEAMFFARTIGALVLANPKEEEGKAVLEGLLMGFAQRMAKMSEVERAMTIIVVTGILPRDMITEVDRAAGEDSSRFVRMAYLAERNPPPDHPAYDAALADPDADWSELARLLREEAAERAAAAAPAPAETPAAPDAQK